MDDVTTKILESYVNKQIPKLQTVNQSDLDSMFETYKPEEIIAQSKMSASDLVDTFKLSFITESLTEQYADTYLTGAKNHGAIWLSNYVTGFWAPDESGHADPFKNILVDFGIDKSELERQVQEAFDSVSYQEVHSSGYHPIELTTYGMIQECITDYWYELQRGFFPEESNTTKILSKVKGREALHTVQFRNLTAIQLESDPGLMKLIIHAISNFQMPSNHIPLVANIESKTQKWIPRMNGDITILLTRIIGNINAMLQDKAKLGELIVGYASLKEKRFLRYVPNVFVSKAIGNIRGGHGLVGEIVLEHLGLESSEGLSPMTFPELIEYRFRTILKRWVSEKMNIEGYLKDFSQVPAQIKLQSL